MILSSDLQNTGFLQRPGGILDAYLVLMFRPAITESALSAEVNDGIMADISSRLNDCLCTTVE